MWVGCLLFYNMKYIALVALVLSMLCTNNSTAQTRVGNVFKAEQRESAPKDTIVTKYVFEDAKGHQYKIICNKSSGACYVWRKSSKTGKMYKSYMKKNIRDAVCKELNIQTNEK